MLSNLLQPRRPAVRQHEVRLRDPQVFPPLVYLRAHGFLLCYSFRKDTQKPALILPHSSFLEFWLESLEYKSLRDTYHGRPPKYWQGLP